MHASSSRSEVYNLLKSGPFARYIAGDSVSMIGTWMQVTVLNYVMTTLTHQASMFGWLFFANGVPIMLLMLHGGTLADRYDKRLILVVTQVIQIGLSVTLGWLIYKHQIHLIHLFIATIISGICTAFEMPTATALLAEIVHKDQIRTAVAIDRANFHATRLIGPALAGLCIAWIGESFALFINALTFIVLIITLLSLPTRKKGSIEEEKQRQTGGMKAGIAYVMSDKLILTMISLICLASVFIFPFLLVLLPLYSTKALGVAAEKMGYLMGLSGLGSLAGVIGLLSVSPSKRLIRFILCSILMGSSLLALGSAYSFYLAALELILLAIGLSMNIGLANVIIQERAPDHLRGRISSVVGLSFFALIPFAGIIVSYLADYIGIRWMLYLNGFAFTLTSITILLSVGKKISFQYKLGESKIVESKILGSPDSTNITDPLEPRLE